MSRVRYAQADVPGLFRRIGFDADLESRAFRSLADLDLENCRATFERLVDGLDLGAFGTSEREASMLLLDVLQRVNRRLCRPAATDRAYGRNRAQLIKQFAAFETAEEARRAFMPALGRLLSRVQPDNLTTHHLVQGAQSFIEERYSHRISLSAVASHLNVSANYLSRVFKRETGTTLTSYIHGVRLEHAMVLLAAGGRSISEIAYLVGYQNYRDFYRNFVKFKKASPRQFQQRLSPDLRAEDSLTLEGGSR